MLVCGYPFDEAVEAEAAEVVAHLVGGVVGVEESGDEPAKALVGEAGDGVDDSSRGRRSGPWRVGHRSAGLRFVGPPVCRAGGCARRAQSRWHSPDRHVPQIADDR